MTGLSSDLAGILLTVEEPLLRVFMFLANCVLKWVLITGKKSPDTEWRRYAEGRGS